MFKIHKILKGALVVFLASFAFVACLDNKYVLEEYSELEQYHLARAAELLGKMSVEQKVNQMSGGPKQQAVVSMMTQIYDAELNIPSMVYCDGPRGAKAMTDDENFSYTTVFPVSINRASSFDVELERKIGEVSGDETRGLGNYVLLAPCINQVVDPRWGRCQETYGEDTYLLGEMGAAFVLGVQESGKSDAVDSAGETIYYDEKGNRSFRVQALIKHYAVNSIENTRRQINAVIDQRTMREVYLPHFKKSIDKADVSAFMTAYNLVNGKYCSQNYDLLKGILYDEWGFKGYTITDWYAKSLNTVESVEAHMGVEMPYSSGIEDGEPFYGPQLLNAITSGAVAEEDINPIVLRILFRKSQYGMLDYGRDFSITYTTGQEDSYHAYQVKSALQKEESIQLALDAAREGMVLIKDGDRTVNSTGTATFLPLDKDDVTITSANPVVMLGQYANIARQGDIGSSNAISSPMGDSLDTTPYQGFEAFLGNERVEYYTGNKDSSGVYYAITDSSHGQPEAVTALNTASWAVVVCSYIPANLSSIEMGIDPLTGEMGAPLPGSGEEGEAMDRDSMALMSRDLGNIQAAIAAKEGSNPNLKIMVLIESGAPVLVESYLDKVDVIVQAWYGGMCGGQAMAELIFGETYAINLWSEVPQDVKAVSFAGKTPITWPKSEAQLPSYPTGRTTKEYTYDYYHGYRWFDKGMSSTTDKTPRYWFGYGLSYNTYSYDNLNVSMVYAKYEDGRIVEVESADEDAVQMARVTVDVTNNGSYDSSESVMAFIGFEGTQVDDTYKRPVKQLFAFDRVTLAAGSTETATMYINPDDMKYYDEATGEMVFEDIEYSLIVADSADPDTQNKIETTITF